MRHVHVITPGDHYSPSTGSAIPSVVHGLCTATPDTEPRPAVVVARGTYPDRYDSAAIIEYDRCRPLRLPGPVSERHVDLALSRVGVPRLAGRRQWTAAISGQDSWEPSFVIGHNAVQLMALLDQERHAPVLYAHNRLLASYGKREAGRALGGVTAIIAVSEWLAEQFLGRLPTSLHERVRVVHNGVDVAAFQQGGPRLAADGPLRVLFIGRMVPDKGPHVLVEAVRLLGRRDVELTLVGSVGFDAGARLTGYEVQLRRALATLGARGKASPFVPRPQVARVMRSADVVVVPSCGPEAFALTALEGMASGAAVIGSDSGGIPESLHEAGQVVRAGDARDLADAIARLADDRTFLAEQQEASLRYARTQDWSRVRVRLGEALARVPGATLGRGPAGER